MEINLVCVGNLKEKYFVEAKNEYVKRLQSFCKVNIIECKEENYKSLSVGDINNAKQKEGQSIIKYLKGYVITLEIGGKELSSEDFAEKLKKIEVDGFSTITFVIGGSYGLDSKVSEKSNLKLSFGKFTYPHQLMRIVCLEQIYRAFTIINNKIYHK